MKALADNVILKPVAEANVTTGGIHLPDGARAETTKGTVLFAGKKVEEVSPGDKVLLPSYAGQKTQVSLENEMAEVWICKESEILCVLESENAKVESECAG